MSFFDAWVPSRPTFGIRPLRSNEPPAGSRTVPPVPAFGSSLFGALVNGRDNLQAAMPGYAERNIDIDLDRGLGESNFWPSATDVEKMLDAATTAVRHFFQPAGWDWPAHRRQRFANVMAEVESNVRGVSLRSSLASVWRAALRIQVEEANNGAGRIQADSDVRAHRGRRALVAAFGAAVRPGNRATSI